MFHYVLYIVYMNIPIRWTLRWMYDTVYQRYVIAFASVNSRVALCHWSPLSFRDVYTTCTTHVVQLHSPIRIFSSWWFGTFFIVPYIGNNHPNWRTHIFQGCRSTTNQFWQLTQYTMQAAEMFFSVWQRIRCEISAYSESRSLRNVCDFSRDASRLTRFHTLCPWRYFTT